VHGRDAFAACLLVLGAHRVGDAVPRELFHACGECLVGNRRRERALLLAVRGAEALLQLDQRLDGGVREEQRIDDDVLLHLVELALDHHDRVLARGDDDVHVGLLALGKGRVRDELAIDATDADAGERACPDEVGDVQRARGGRHREDVGGVLLVERDHVRDDLRVDEPALREERADRAVHQATDEDLVVRGATFAAEEAAGNLARRVELLLVLAGQGHEVDVARLLRAGGGNEDHRVPAANDDRAARLLGPLAGLDDNFLAANVGGLTYVRHSCLFLGVTRRRPAESCGLVPLSNALFRGPSTERSNQRDL
jgi:hypothetical protein